MYSLQSCKFFLLFLALKSANPGNILPQKLKTLVFRLPCLIFALTNVEHSICVELCDNGTLAYTQISHKTYYKPEDVMAIVAVVEDKKKDMRFRKRTG